MNVNKKLIVDKILNFECLPIGLWNNTMLEKIETEIKAENDCREGHSLIHFFNLCKAFTIRFTSSNINHLKCKWNTFSRFECVKNNASLMSSPFK